MDAQNPPHHAQTLRPLTDVESVCKHVNLDPTKLDYGEQTARTTRTLVEYAAKGHTEGVRDLLLGENAHALTRYVVQCALASACGHEKVHTVRALLSVRPWSTLLDAEPLLVTAVQKGNKELITCLLDAVVRARGCSRVAAAAPPVCAAWLDEAVVAGMELCTGIHNHVIRIAATHGMAPSPEALCQGVMAAASAGKSETDMMVNGLLRVEGCSASTLGVGAALAGRQYQQCLNLVLSNLEDHHDQYQCTAHHILKAVLGMHLQQRHQRHVHQHSICPKKRLEEWWTQVTKPCEGAPPPMLLARTGVQWALEAVLERGNISSWKVLKRESWDALCHLCDVDVLQVLYAHRGTGAPDRGLLAHCRQLVQKGDAGPDLKTACTQWLDAEVAKLPPVYPSGPPVCSSGPPAAGGSVSPAVEDGAACPTSAQDDALQAALARVEETRAAAVTAAARATASADALTAALKAATKTGEWPAGAGAPPKAQ